MVIFLLNSVVHHLHARVRQLRQRKLEFIFNLIKNVDQFPTSVLDRNLRLLICSCLTLYFNFVNEWMRLAISSEPDCLVFEKLHSD